ncbi:hypothetical protein PAECIP112173_03616 [Paenibacillus sp. JJ-100]|uniref:ankyrin repeat domain-containing protein n=1 Tax=Paenibacillus sp. JJ-100 TaxID=2974896 RepID=UPI0022FFB333|nr:ankyrin repeat domain-containing protein [Paenibacillus sp. JJ-100]CAI6082580.1 hypothetical protein PAECIP112173_03616 [Paenibacillus sp. JJ-100]
MKEEQSDTAMVEQLFQAAEHGEINKLKSLLQERPELANIENKDGLTALGYAAHYGQAGSVQLLLEHGADVNAVSHSRISFIPSNTALHAALAGERSLQVIRQLLEHGTSTSIPDSDGQHALHTAAFHTDQTAIIELLLEHGADVSAQDAAGATALQIAQQRGNSSVAALLQQVAPPIS